MSETFECIEDNTGDTSWCEIALDTEKFVEFNEGETFPVCRQSKFLPISATKIYKYNFPEIIGLTRKWLKNLDHGPHIQKTSIPSYKADFINNYSDDIYDYTIISGYPFENLEVSIGEYDYVDSIDVITIVSKKSVGCVFLLINFLFENETKTPITTKIQNCKADRILEIFSDFPNISSPRSFFLALLSSKGILKESEVQECLANEQSGSTSMNFKGNFVSVRDLIAAGAAKYGKKIFYIGCDEKILFLEKDQEPKKYHLNEKECSKFNLEAIEELKEDVHFSIIPFCIGKENNKSSNILVNCDEGQIDTLNEKLRPKQKIEAIAYRVMHLESNAQSRKVFTLFERSTNPEDGIDWNLAQDIANGKKVVIVLRKNDCVTIVYNHSTWDSEISSKYIPHWNLKVQMPTHHLYPATDFKVSLSKEDTFRSRITIFVVTVFLVGIAPILWGTENERLLSAFSISLSLIMIVWNCLQNSGGRLKVFPLEERIRGVVSVDSWEKLVALAESDDAGRYRWLSMSEQNQSLLALEGSCMFHSERKRYGVVEYPGLRDLWMPSLGIFEIENDAGSFIIDSNKFYVAEVKVASSSRKYVQNWRTLQGEQIGGCLVYPSGKLFR